MTNLNLGFLGLGESSSCSHIFIKLSKIKQIGLAYVNSALEWSFTPKPSQAKFAKNDHPQGKLTVTFSQFPGNLCFKTDKCILKCTF